MVEYKVVVAAHRVEDIRRAKRAFKATKYYGGSAGIYEPKNFQSQINGLLKDGWTVVFSNATSYGMDGFILYALLRKD